LSYVTFPTVQTIINGVSQDIRTQLSALSGTPGTLNATQQSILVDYTNRVHKQMLRFSRWAFLLSEPQFFLTQKGQSVYWIGPKGQAPPGCVDTGLNFPDVDKIKKDSVSDLSNQANLKWLTSSPIGPNLINRAGQGRPGLPATFGQNPNDPNVLFIYPPPDNENATQPTPQVPVVATTVGGALPLRTYLLKITYVDQLGGESTSTSTGAPLFIPAGQLAVVKSPSMGIFGQLPDGGAVSGLQYNAYNVYAQLATFSGGQIVNDGSETLQNGGTGPIPIGTDWTEPNTGLITTGAAVPNNNTLQQINAYVIKFQYYKNRINLSQLSGVGGTLQIPDDYFDVVIQGVQALAWKLLGKDKEASLCYQLYKAGMTEMVADKNLFPEGVEYIRPDTNTYVNTQILGYLDPFF
jgi:hypothetical protein